MIPQDTVEQILDTAKIEDVVGDFVNLRRRGVNMLGLCPFHDEKTPSFTVSPTKGIYKCFGCGRAGNVSKFIMDHESIGYWEALRYLANKYNIEIVEREITPEERQAQQLSESLYILNQFAASYFDQQLFSTIEGKSIGLSYFKERGYIEKTIKKWNLGYSNQHYDDFTKQATLKSYNPEILKKSGLTTRSNKDFFNARVMFAIHNLSGKIIAFAGRTLSKEKSQPKYINSPETDIYEKRKILYGIYHAKTPIRREDECLLVEGYTDVITLSQGGIENVVASSGTALTASQIKLIRRFTNNVKVIYDGDRAGIMAALRGLDLILEQDMSVRLVLLPDGEDPDSYLKSVGTDVFKEYLEDNAKDFILFKTDLLLEEAGNDPIKKSRVIGDIVGSIAKVPNAISRSNYTKVCCELLDVDEELLVAEVKKAVDRIKEEKYKEYQRNQRSIDQQNFEDATIVSDIPADEQNTGVSKVVVDRISFKDEHQEKDLVRILITGGDSFYDEENKITIAEYLVHNLEESLDEFDNPLYQSIFNIAIDALKNEIKVDSRLFTNHNDPDVQKIAIDVSSFPYSLSDWESKGVYLQTQPVPEKNFVRDSLQAILRFRLRKSVKLLNQVKSELSNSELSDEDKILNIKIYQQLLKDKNEIMSALDQVM